MPESHRKRHHNDDKINEKRRKRSLREVYDDDHQESEELSSDANLPSSDDDNNRLKRHYKKVVRYINRDKFRRIRSILRRAPNVVNHLDSNGWTLLHHAAFSRDKHAADLLLSYGISTTTEDELGNRARDISRELKDIETAEVLCRNDKDRDQFLQTFIPLPSSSSTSSQSYHPDARNKPSSTASDPYLLWKSRMQEEEALLRDQGRCSNAYDDGYNNHYGDHYGGFGDEDGFGANDAFYASFEGGSEGSGYRSGGGLYGDGREGGLRDEQVNKSQGTPKEKDEKGFLYADETEDEWAERIWREMSGRRRAKREAEQRHFFFTTRQQGVEEERERRRKEAEANSRRILEEEMREEEKRRKRKGMEPEREEGEEGRREKKDSQKEKGSAFATLTEAREAYECRWVTFLKTVNSLLTFHYDAAPWPAVPDNQYVAMVLTGAGKDGARARIKAELLRWHPDKFMSKFGSKIREVDRQKVIDDVRRISQMLTEHICRM
uniref:NF-kappa-B inhibitor-like protein 1 n=1 Tax=Polytomella parva TaxID=51329 RepID=A0A7S0Y8Q0_9CHLO|mmetsp:Transcript_14409/g.25222  ORF Transcript_14409/g.25222 Transcript_14409/m.25222 type:complete len:494 (+) Transcript_14409:149-1630(+)